MNFLQNFFYDLFQEHLLLSYAIIAIFVILILIAIIALIKNLLAFFFLPKYKRIIKDFHDNFTSESDTYYDFNLWSEWLNKHKKSFKKEIPKIG